MSRTRRGEEEMSTRLLRPAARILLLLALTNISVRASADSRSKVRVSNIWIEYSPSSFDLARRLYVTFSNSLGTVVPACSPDATHSFASQQARAPDPNTPAGALMNTLASTAEISALEVYYSASWRSDNQCWLDTLTISRPGFVQAVRDHGPPDLSDTAFIGAIGLIVDSVGSSTLQLLHDVARCQVNVAASTVVGRAGVAGNRENGSILLASFLSGTRVKFTGNCFWQSFEVFREF